MTDLTEYRVGDVIVPIGRENKYIVRSIAPRYYVVESLFLAHPDDGVGFTGVHVILDKAFASKNYVMVGKWDFGLNMEGDGDEAFN